MLAKAIGIYLSEVDSYRSTCERHNKTAAIHTRGTELQVYRMFKKSDKLCQHLHQAVKGLPSWEESIYCKSQGGNWEKLKSEVEARVDSHSMQCHVASRGVLWDEIPMLVHAYKFDDDPHLKIELVVPEFKPMLPILPLRIIASSLHCHEYLVPKSMASALPPYAGHEIEFMSLWEYLSQTMPKDLYASTCFPQSNGDVP